MYICLRPRVVGPDVISRGLEKTIWRHPLFLSSPSNFQGTNETENGMDPIDPPLPFHLQSLTLWMEERIIHQFQIHHGT